MIKQFKDLEDNVNFKVNGIEYQKIPVVRISCCKSINAKQLDNESQRIFVLPNTEVEVND